MEYFQNKNIELYDFLNENFGIRKTRNWNDISMNITKAKISATYKVFSKLFPMNIDYLAINNPGLTSKTTGCAMKTHPVLYPV